MLPALWEIIIPLILAVLLGIFIGWLIWRWRRQVISETEWLIAQQRLVSLESDLEAAEAERDTASESKAQAFIDLDEAKKAERTLESELETARVDLTAANEGKDAAEARLGELDECNATVATLTADLASARSETDTAQQASATLEAELAAAKARIEELEGADDPAVNWKQGVTTLGTPGASHKDDLKVVNGIGPKMEELLNGFGIQSWEQLAWLSADEVQRVDDALEEFPGRIERDEWVPQANDLIARFPDRADRPTRETFLNRSAET